MKQKDLLFLAISSSIVVAAWIVFNIIHAATYSKVAIEIGDDAAPIDPTFNTKVLEELKAKQQIPPQYSYVGVTQTPTPVATNAAVPNISPPLTPTPTFVATGSATQGGILVL